MFVQGGNMTAPRCLTALAKLARPLSTAWIFVDPAPWMLRQSGPL